MHLKLYIYYVKNFCYFFIVIRANEIEIHKEEILMFVDNAVVKKFEGDGGDNSGNK